MKTILIAFIFICTFFSNAGIAYAQEKSTVVQETTYVILSDDKFNEIEAKMYLQEDWNPIRIEGYNKEELVAFYIQSYSEKIISTWVDFAYKKMNNFEAFKPTPKQEKTFQKILKLPRTAQNAHYFMMIMTKEQIETIGY